MTDDFYHDEFGAEVKLIMTLQTGEVITEHLPPLLAAVALLADERMGREVKSARIRFGGLYDDYGQSA